jgi:hypothetical protein
VNGVYLNDEFYKREVVAVGSFPMDVHKSSLLAVFDAKQRVYPEQSMPEGPAKPGGVASDAFSDADAGCPRHRFRKNEPAPWHRKMPSHPTYVS